MTDTAALNASYDVFAPSGLKLVTIHTCMLLTDLLGCRREAVARIILDAPTRDGCTLHGNGRMILGCDFVTVRAV